MRRTLAGFCSVAVLSAAAAMSAPCADAQTNAYVARSGANSVTVIDIATNAVVHSFLTGTFSVSVAISPDGTRAYVATIFYNFDNPFGFAASGGVVVLDTATDTAIKTIGLFASLPSSIALAPDGAHGYVAIQSTWVNTGYGAGFLPGRSVAVIDTSAGTVTGSTDVGKAAAALAATPDGSSIYATIPVINSVVVIDAATRAVTATIPVGGNPIGVAIVPNAPAAPAPPTLPAPAPGKVTVTIDIKPGASPNTVSPGSPKELVAVGILSTPAFDATTIDPATIRFGAAGTEASPVEVKKTVVDRIGSTICSSASRWATRPSGAGRPRLCLRLGPSPEC